MSRGNSSDPVGGMQSSLARSTTQRSEGASTSIGSEPGGSDSWSSLPGLEDPESIDPAELEEFMAADEAGVQADPVFKERLRRTLWRMVNQRPMTSDQGDD
ncbi:MAG: hypothetical protein P8M78_01605 [Myxococcota bacterium]|nr:hypothetical protein [Myxococcota bacterium]